MRKKIGTWITSFNQHTLEVISNSGFSWICIDLEHSDISDKEANILISLAKKNKIKPYVRVASKSEENFKKALDGGAVGIIVPMVESKEDVDDIINFSYYSPNGKRSFGLYSHNLYGIDKDHLRIKKYNPEIILQIESLKGINNLESILSNKLISGSLIGRYDLSLTLNEPGNFKSKKFNRCIKKYFSICKKKKVKSGIHLAEFDLKNIKSEIKNYDFIAIGTDFIFLKKMCDLLFKNIK